jgi:hypothetical protein
MNFILERLFEHDAGTFGRLRNSDGDFDCMTLEPLLLDGGLIEHSCVPAGDYELVRYSSPKYKHTWALVGRYVSALKEPQTGVRFGILFHSGNWERDTEGCILPGAGIATMRPPLEDELELAVTDSVRTTGRLIALLDESRERNYLTIVDIPSMTDVG